MIFRLLKSLAALAWVLNHSLSLISGGRIVLRAAAPRPASIHISSRNSYTDVVNLFSILCIQCALLIDLLSAGRCSLSEGEVIGWFVGNDCVLSYLVGMRSVLWAVQRLEFIGSRLTEGLVVAIRGARRLLSSQGTTLGISMDHLCSCS